MARSHHTASYQTTADIYTELDQEKTVNFNTSNLYNWKAKTVNALF